MESSGLALAARPRSAAWRLLGDYVSLTKPRIMLLLLVTEMGTFLAASHGRSGLALGLVALAGGGLSAGGAAAINCWFDRDIDAHMDRTCERPIPAGRIAAGNGLAFGLALSAAGFLVLTFGANLLAGLLALSGGVFYVLVYTMWLKRSTSQNIVIGGAAGAFPPLVGWAIVTHSLSLEAVVLFAVIFFWTPPHFWALALLLRRQYAGVRVPMLPSLEGGEARARRSILVYSIVLLAVSIVPAIWLGPVYLASSLVLGLILVGLAGAALRERGRRWAALLFHFSILYLGLLFVAVAAGGIAG
ncbi:MAG: heme o synthase [Candidatus Dormibacteraceae bacterium]